MTDTLHQAAQQVLTWDFRLVERLDSSLEGLAEDAANLRAALVAAPAGDHPLSSPWLDALRAKVEQGDPLTADEAGELVSAYDSLMEAYHETEPLRVLTMDERVARLAAIRADRLGRAGDQREQPNAFWRDQAKLIAEIAAGICERVGVVPGDAKSTLSMVIALGEKVQELRSAAAAPAAGEPEPTQAPPLFCPNWKDRACVRPGGCLCGALE